MDKKILFGLLIFMLTCSNIANAIAAPTSGSTSDPVDDIVFNKYSNSSGYSVTVVSRPSIDITSLNYELDQSHLLTLTFEFKGEPTVDKSFFYSANLVLQTDNGTSFTVVTYYSNFVAQESEADNNQTLVSISLIGSGFPSIEVQNTVTHAKDKTIFWNVNLANFTSIFTSNDFKLMGLYGLSGEEETVNADNTNYYMDQINNAENNPSDQTAKSTDTGFTPIAGLPLWLSLSIALSVVYRKRELR